MWRMGGVWTDKPPCNGGGRSEIQSCSVLSTVMDACEIIGMLCVCVYAGLCVARTSVVDAVANASVGVDANPDVDVGVACDVEVNVCVRVAQASYLAVRVRAIYFLHDEQYRKHR